MSSSWDSLKKRSKKLRTLLKSSNEKFVNLDTTQIIRNGMRSGMSIKNSLVHPLLPYRRYPYYYPRPFVGLSYYYDYPYYYDDGVFGDWDYDFYKH